MERFDPAYEFIFQEEAGGEKTVPVLANGIDGADMLQNADTAFLLQQHLAINLSDVKSFWKDGYLLIKMWITGDYRNMIPTTATVAGGEVRTTDYPWTRDGFSQFLHDHGSVISPDEVGRRCKVFRAYNKYTTTTIRLVEKAGVNKAFLAVPYIKDSVVNDVLEVCVATPYHNLRKTLDTNYSRDGKKTRNTKTADELARDNETRAVKTISENHRGMIGRGDSAIFIPRKYRQTAKEERYAMEVFDMVMHKTGVNDRDAFFMNVVVSLLAKTYLNDADLRSIDQRLAAQQAGDDAQRFREAA